MTWLWLVPATLPLLILMGGIARVEWAKWREEQEQARPKFVGWYAAEKDGGGRAWVLRYRVGGQNYDWFAYKGDWYCLDVCGKEPGRRELEDTLEHMQALQSIGVTDRYRIENPDA